MKFQGRFAPLLASAENINFNDSFFFIHRFFIVRICPVLTIFLFDTHSCFGSFQCWVFWRLPLRIRKHLQKITTIQTNGWFWAKMYALRINSFECWEDNNNTKNKIIALSYNIHAQTTKPKVILFILYLYIQRAAERGRETNIIYPNSHDYYFFFLKKKTIFICTPVLVSFLAMSHLNGDFFVLPLFWLRSREKNRHAYICTWIL